MTEKQFRIVYCSRNRMHGSPDEVAQQIQDILAKSRVNNRKVDVTGALLYNAGSFAQVLEGPLAAVEGRFEVIQRDTRHSDVTVIEIGPISDRQFGNWSMGLAENTTETKNNQIGRALDAVFTNAEEGGEQILETLQDLVVSDVDWILMDAA